MALGLNFFRAQNFFFLCKALINIYINVMRKYFKQCAMLWWRLPSINEGEVVGSTPTRLIFISNFHFSVLFSLLGPKI